MNARNRCLLGIGMALTAGVAGAQTPVRIRKGAGGLTATQAFGHKIDNLSVTCLEFGAAPRVLSINHIP